jgi:methyl-accepting chemotaxis protein
MNIQRHTEKLNTYRNTRTEKLTNTLIHAFGNANLTVEIPKSEYDNDTAEIAKAQDEVEAVVQKATNTIKSYVDEVSNILESIAGGDLTVGITREYIGDFDSIKRSVNSIISRLNETVTDISLVADGVNSGSAQLSQSSMNLSEGVSQQMLSMQEITEGIGTVDTQAKDNSSNSQKASALAATSKSDAETGNTEMQQLLGAMSRISESSNKISQIIKTIEGIAFQTNLLALNAAVEAARAGEMGKGFGVVAEEVRSLAGRSSEAAKQTAELIQESMQNVQDGTKAASDTAASLDKIVKNVINVSDVIKEISESSEKQTDTIGSISGDLLQVNQIIQSSAATSEETAAAAEELDSQVSILKEKLAFFSTSASALAANKIWSTTTSDKLNPTSLKNIPGEQKKFTSGEKIISEGDTKTDTMYFVLDGNVKVVKSIGTLNEKTLATLKPGDLFGEMALFLKEPRTASIVASGNATVIEIHRDTLSQVMERSPETAFVIIETLCMRLRDVVANIADY